MVMRRIEGYRDQFILIARILLVLLLIISGFDKLTNFNGSVSYFRGQGVPFAEIVAIIAIVIEFFGGLAILFGFYARRVAVIMIVYILIVTIFGTNFGNIEGMVRMGALQQFYKNLGLIGGFLLFVLTGPGRFSINQK